MGPFAAIQYRPPRGDAPRARRALAAMVDEAGGRGARLIVCPEMATSGYVWEDAAEILPHCEPARGPTLEALAPVAAERGAWVVVGFPERAPDGALYNSALVIDDRGQLVDCYRKVLLYDADTTWARPGRRRPVYDIPAGRMTPGICMDLNDFGFGLHLLSARPEVVAFCTNWVDEGEDILPYWRERMLGWRGWFVAADRWGEDRGVRFYGRSAILAPGGAVAAIAPAEGDAILVAGPP